MASNRDLARRLHAREYFTFGDYSWAPKYIVKMNIKEVMCPECDYVPRRDSTQPRRAFKAHVKKYHARLYSEKFMKPFIIHEEPDFDLARELEALINA